MKVTDMRAMADAITDEQLDYHRVTASGREFMINVFGFEQELSEVGKEAVRMAKAKRMREAR